MGLIIRPTVFLGVGMKWHMGNDIERRQGIAPNIPGLAFKYVMTSEQKPYGVSLCSSHRQKGRAGIVVEHRDLITRSQ